MKERIEKICFNLISVKLDKTLFDSNNIIEAMKKDKKRRTEKLAAVLLATDLSLKVVQDIEFAEIEESLSNIFNTLQRKK